MEVSTKIHMTHISEVLLSPYYKRRGNMGGELNTRSLTYIFIKSHGTIKGNCDNAGCREWI